MKRDFEQSSNKKTGSLTRQSFRDSLALAR